MKKILLLFAFSSILIVSWGQDLKRRPFLGILMGPVSAEIQQTQKLPDESGIHVRQVFDNSSAKASGILAGDVIRKMDEQPMSGPGDLLAQLKHYQSGDEVLLSLYRAGKLQEIRLRFTPFPEESFAGAQLQYGTVQAQHGQLRSILTVPEGTETAPVLYIIQGIDCGSVDAPFSPDNAFHKLIQRFTDQGYATYRVEKSGVGDSQGKPCGDCDFLEDAHGFLEGLKSLKQNPLIDSSQIYLLGLSMGGVWAPWMARQEQVGGLMVYGTISRPWIEYMLENSRRQAILGGLDYDELEKSLKRDARLYHYMFNEKLSPNQIIEQYPEMTERLHQISPERERGNIRHLHAGRTYQFQVQLQELNMAAQWKEVNAPVLAVWGKGDYISNQEDHSLIAEMANFYKPGSGTYKEVDANHFFEQAGSEAEAFAARQNNTELALNEDVFNLFLEWIEGLN